MTLRLFNRRNQKTAVSIITTITTTTTTRATLSPLDIPEVLDVIFSCLDDYTIRRSVIHVCRQWYLLNQHRLVHEITWYHCWGPSKKQKLLQRLPGACRLYYGHISSDTSRRAYLFDESLRRILEALECKYQKYLKQRQQQQGDALSAVAIGNSNTDPQTTTSASTLGRHYSTFLKEMYVYVNMGARRVIFHTWFYLPTSLTRLTITTTYPFDGECELDKFLQRCPLLEYFCAQGQGLPSWPWRSLSISSPTTRQQQQEQQQEQQQQGQELQQHRPFRLRSLVLLGVSFEQADLESLLPLLPDLKELKLIAMFWFEDGSRYDWARLFGSLRANNITLDKAHFSTGGCRMSAEEADQLWTEECPQLSKEISLWAMDVTPQLLQSVFQHQNTLTVLEVLWKRDLRPSDLEICTVFLADAHRLIHHYLCDSRCLVHLITLKTVIRLDELDIFNRAGYTNLNSRQYPSLEETTRDTSSPPQPLPIVWQCRKLRTLHLIAHLPGRHQFNRPVYSRILFGYISRVCPALEDLQICIPQQCHVPPAHIPFSPVFHMELKGGLCLLGRLQHLQKLKVVLDESVSTLVGRDWELNWMLKSRRKNVKARQRRQQEVASWREWRANEDKIEVARSGSRQRASVDGTNSVITTDARILDELQNLGLLLDVAEMVKEMDAKEESESCPMPALERLSFNFPILLRPEEVFGDLFPTKYKKKWGVSWRK